MKFTSNQSALLSIAAGMAKVANGKVIPILDYILCDVSLDTITMTAGDGTVSLTCTAYINLNEGEGRFCVNAKQLYQALAELPGEQLQIEVTDTRLTVTHTRGNTYIPVLPTEEYPTPPEQQYDNHIEIPSEWLMRALKGAAFATASDELRQQMTGINVKSTGSGVDVVATDGRALVVFHSDSITDDTCSFGSSFTMPKKAAEMVATLSHEDTIHVEWNDTHALVTASDTELRFVLLEGTYPKYEAVIPTEHKTLITVLRSQFITALRRVAPFCDHSSELAVITVKDGVIAISGEDDCNQSGATTTLDAEIEGEDVTVGVSASLLLAELQRIPSLEIKMYLLDSNRPIVMRHEDDGESVVMLAMPMRVESD